MPEKERGMLDRKNNKIYIQYKENDAGGSITAIFGSAIGFIGIYNNIFNKEYESEVLRIIFQSKFTMVLFIMICVVIFIIGVLNILFSNNIDFHVDLYSKKLVLIQGRKPFGKNINIDFNQIREINILRTKKLIEKENNRYENIDNYIMEIYDSDLNAYTCYDNADIEKIMETANELAAVFNVIVIDRTDCIDYEGFKQRII
jgi:hypothetical protein